MVSNIYKNKFNPDNIALRYKGQSVTYGELDIHVQKYASHFSKLGIKEDDKVALICINSPQFIYSYLGIVKTGAIVVPLNILLTVEELSYIIKNSEAKAIVVHPIMLQKTKLTKERVEEALGISVYVLDQEFFDAVKQTPIIEFKNFNDKNKVSTFLFTSGTTGKPKAAMLTHHNLVSNVIQTANTFEIYPEDKFMCVLPMFHVFGFTDCVLLPLYKGITIIIVEMFQPKEVIETLLTEGVTIFMGVPSMYVIFLEAVKSNITFPKLRLAISGGASLPVEIFRRAKEELSFPIIEGYGLSEASPGAAFNPVNGVRKAGSIGLPLWGIECKIVDENGNEVPQGEVGELIIKGDNVMLGYYKQGEETKKAIRNGWLYTEDLAKKDEDGYIYIVDRKKDLIIVSGLNVYPREVEEVIYKYPKVKEATVIGVGDTLRGEYVKAFIVLREGEECTSKELLRYLKQHLALYKIPREVEFVADLPKNSTGKILKRMLNREI